MMLQQIKKLIKRTKLFLTWDEWMNISWSQEGEDLLLNRLFEVKHNGFYVDVGSHHPKRFSNTYFFYKRGWKGINIDPQPGSKLAFDKLRPRDINIETGIGITCEELTYYMFNEPALNGFSRDISLKRSADSANDYKLIGTKKIRVSKLENILDEFLPKNQKIDFLSIDVEGLDLQVLKSNNWSKFRPQFVLAESLAEDLIFEEKSELVKYMESKGYLVVAKTMNTIFFKII